MIPMNHKSSFPWRAFLKSVAAIAVPVALQNLLTTTGSMIDTVMLASLGKETVGGVGLCAQFSSLMFSGYWGFVGGGILFMSQYFGAKDDDGVNRAYGLTLSCMMVVGLIFMTLAVAFLILFGCHEPRMFNQSTLVLGYLLLYGYDVSGRDFTLRLAGIAFGALLVCTVFLCRHRSRSRRQRAYKSQF